MKLRYLDGAFILQKGITLVAMVPCPTHNDLPFATVMLMGNIYAVGAKDILIENMCQWTVSNSSSLQAILTPLFELEEELV